MRSEERNTSPENTKVFIDDKFIIRIIIHKFFVTKKNSTHSCKILPLVREREN